MGKIGTETCGVCHDQPSKYRCPGCDLPYCSLACNKVHKVGSQTMLPCSGKRAPAECKPDIQQPAPATKVGISAANSSNSTQCKRLRTADDGDCNGGSRGLEEAETRVQAGVTCVRKPRDQWRGGRLEKNEEVEWAMSADQKTRMLGCEWLKAALRDPTLQALLTEVDQAKDREKALAFHRTSPQFGEFMDKLLLEIEEYRRGGADEPDLVASEP